MAKLAAGDTPSARLMNSDSAKTAQHDLREAEPENVLAQAPQPARVQFEPTMNSSSAIRAR